MVKYKEKESATVSSGPAPSGVAGSFGTIGIFRPWQPSTWPPAPAKVDAQFIGILERIFRESMLDEIGNVIEDAKKNNGSLEHRGHVVALALMCALEAVSAYGYRDRSKTYMADFIANHFPSDYRSHSKRFYRLYRVSLVHNWNLFEATLLPGNEKVSTSQGTLAFGILNFFDALQTGVRDFLNQLKTNKKLQQSTLTRYRWLKKTAKP